MWPHLANLLSHSWQAFLQAEGTTGLGWIGDRVVVPVAIFVITLIVIWARRGWRDMTEHWMKTLSWAFAVALTVLFTWHGLIFGWSLVKSVYGDHQWAISKIVELQSTPTMSCPSCPECPKANAFVEPANSLRRRTIALVEELNEFWRNRPSPAGQIGPSNPEYLKYYRDAQTAYENEHFRQRLVGIVSQYKMAGVDTGTMEQAFSQPERLVGSIPYGGWSLENCFSFMSELCQLENLAYHIDAHDQPIILTSKSSVRK